MLNADLTNAGRQSVAGGSLRRLIVQTAFPSINLTGNTLTDVGVTQLPTYGNTLTDADPSCHPFDGCLHS